MGGGGSSLKRWFSAVAAVLGVSAIGLIVDAASARAQQTGKFASVFQATHPNSPIDITGRKFIYDYKTDTFVVSGDAVVTQAHTILTADQVKLLRRQRVMHATGDVHLVDPFGTIRASDAKINLDDESADLKDATITDVNQTYRLEGARVRKLVNQHYSVLDGFFTTCGCEPGTPDWAIEAQQMDLQMGNTGVARNGYFDILGYKAIPLPYAVFPAATDRHSGFLSPRIGESGFRGFQYFQPYYLAINKSSDATIAADVETSLRVGLMGEYRLLSGKDDFFIVDGGFYNESLRSQASRVTDVVDNQIADPHIPVDRYDIIGMVRQHLTDDLVAYGDALSVSDSLLLRELDVWTLSRTIGPGIFYPSEFQEMRNAQSDFGLIDAYNGGYAQFGGVWNQDLIQAQPFALQTLPELLVSGQKQLFGGLLYSDYDFSGVDFWREQGQRGLRLDLNPRVTMPWRLGDYLFGWGTLGLDETIYDTNGRQIIVTPVGTNGLQYNNSLAAGPLGQNGLKTREMIYGSAGIGSELEKIYNLNWKSIEKIKHTIEPFATYSYVPRIDQSDLPLYDEVDRIQPRSLFTYGFTSEFFAKYASSLLSNVEGGGFDLEQDSAIVPFRADTRETGGAVAELFRMTVEQAYDTTYAVAKGYSRFSDVDVTMLSYPAKFISTLGQMGFDPSADRITYAAASLNFEPWWLNNVPRLYMGKAEEGSFVQLSYAYIAPGPAFSPGVNSNYANFIVLRSYYDLFDRMGVYLGPSYDLANHKLLYADYGLRIKSPCDCWSFDMGIAKTYNPSETQFQFQLTLGGLGSIGQSPFGRNPFQIQPSYLPMPQQMPPPVETQQQSVN